MTKKLCVVLLVLAFVLGSVGGFWLRPAVANIGSKISLCTAEPWHDEDWNKATPPPGSDQNSANSSTTSIQSENKVEPQKVQQKPERPFWSRLRFLLFNLKLLLGGK